MQNRLRYDCMHLVLNRLLPHVTSRVTWFRRNGCNGETVLMDYVRLFITHESLCRFETWNDACGEFQCEYGTECVASGVEKGACWRFFRSIGRATHVVTDVGP